MANTQEKFKTAIGGQALIEGIMMRGPDKDAVVVRKDGQLHTETTPRNVPPRGSFKTWPLIRGAVNFFDAQVTGVKALMRSADLSPEETQEELSKFDQWLAPHPRQFADRYVHHNWYDLPRSSACTAPCRRRSRRTRSCSDF